LIVETLARLRPRSCIIDGEAVVCDNNGMVSFDHIRYRRHDSSAFLYAFDLIELNGDDLRRDPLESRKATLAKIVASAGHGLWFNDHIEDRIPPRLQTGARRHRVEAKGSLGPLARLAQDEEPSVRGGKAGGRRRLGPVMEGKNTLAISVPSGETTVLKYFQERMPYGLSCQT
jgi:hypothetical protein